MKIKISIEKKYGYVIISLIVLIVIGVVVVAYTQPIPNPGHGGETGVLVTSVQGDEQFLQDSINREDFKPYTGIHEAFYFDLNDNTVSTSLGDGNLPELLGEYNLCLISYIHSQDKRAFICRVFPRGAFTEEYLEANTYPFDYEFPKQKVEWYAQKSNDIDCKAVCINWK